MRFGYGWPPLWRWTVLSLGLHLSLTLWRMIRNSSPTQRPLAERTKGVHLEHMNAAFDYFEGAGRNLFHRDIRQILLIPTANSTPNAWTLF
jgi:hypothetical protein